MGQEASLPLPNQGDDEFEEQARAPPSSTYPPANHPHPNHHHQSTNARPGSKMIGAMLHRNGSQSPGHSSGRGGGGVDYEGKELARAAAVAGQIPLHSAYTNGSVNSNMPMQQHYANLQHLTPEDQQQYYQQHQNLISQQQQQHLIQQHMLQQQSQPYYQQQLQHHQLQSTPPLQQTQHAGVQQYASSVVGEVASGAAAMLARTASPGGGKKGRGQALINSMRNMNLGTTIRSGVQATAAAASAAVKASSSSNRGAGEVADWETKWDEDEDDSEDEDEGEADVETDAAGVAVSAATMHYPQQQYMPQQHLPQQYPIHPQQQQMAAAAYPMRPGMDAGHSSMMSEQHRLQQQQQQQVLQQATPQTPNRKNIVTPIPQEEEYEIQTSPQRSHQLLHHKSDDGIEWDTGVPQEDDQLSTKPNVQMFLPLLRVLGKGSFGKVVLVQKRVGKERGSLFAMKILRKTHLVKRRQIERTRTERKVLSAVNHPFIMKLHYAFQTPEKLYLVLDYCPGGELFFHLSRFRRFPERVARFYAAELLLAIGHLHKRGIIYRDLKPENVLLDADGHVKLGDFGLAKAGLKHPCEGATSMCGTPEYMAPEVLGQHGHGFCVDYWGLGMLLYEMMTGLPPWYTTDRSKLFRRLKSAPLDIPNYFSPQSANCVSALLERNPRRRLGVTGVRTAMEHEFFRSINWRALYGRRVEAPIRPCEGWKPPEAVNDDDIQSPPMEHAESTDLDAATANFDNTFTRMPVDTEDGNEGQSDDLEAAEELNEDTFVGFTFDDDKDREAVVTGRQRTQQIYQQQPGPQHPRSQID